MMFRLFLEKKVFAAAVLLTFFVVFENLQIWLFLIPPPGSKENGSSMHLTPSKDLDVNRLFECRECVNAF